MGPADLKGLLRTALKSDNPSLVITHAFGYGAEDEVPDDDYEIPFGQAAVKREGSDVTIVACSMMVVAALEAAEQLAGEGIEAEVIDLRTLVPLDEQAILDSVAKTGHLVITDEGRLRCGVASEIAATVSEHGFESLKAPPRGWRAWTRRSPATRSRRPSSRRRPRRSSRRRSRSWDRPRPRSRWRAVDHFLVLTDDIDATRDFWCDALGLEVGERPPLEFPGYWLYAGGVPCVHVAERSAYEAHSERIGIPAATGPGRARGLRRDDYDEVGRAWRRRHRAGGRPGARWGCGSSSSRTPTGSRSRST